MTRFDTSNAHDHQALTSLDEDQFRAASTVDGPVRIIAGAGAGKTRTITHRIAYACSIGAWKPEETLAVTFSVKAAQEMKTRLASLGVSEAVHVATFHSAALSQIHAAWYELSDNPFPDIVEDSRTLLAAALKRAGHAMDVDPIHMRDILAEISWMKVSLIAPSDYVRVCAALHRLPPAELDSDGMASIATAFEAEKSSRNQIDFNDILLIACAIIERNPEVATTIRSHTKHVTVDEYQDVSPLQHRLLQLWMGDSTSVCVVGDAAQTIYSFAGASSYYLRHFDQEFGPLSADVQLNTDYRSTPQIVNYANMVLSGSPEREAYLTLQSPKDSGKRVNTVVFPDDMSEARAIAQRIKRMMHSGHDIASVAILTRVNAQQRLVCAALAEQHIRYQIRTDSGWQSSSVAVPAHEPHTLDNLKHQSSSQTQSHSQTNTEVDAAELQDVEALRAKRLKVSMQTVTVSTIHAAKGLEFSHVFIVGCSEGLIPFGGAQHDNLEEERRLMYVAITRAQDVLTLSFARTAHPGGHLGRKASRFLLRSRN